MKKLLRIIPLMVMPLLLSSCNIFSFNSLSKDESSESQSSDNTSQSSSDNNVSSEDSSETSSSSSSEETPVGPVLPTSITISGPAEVSIGETIQLSALVLPENATNKTVTWSHTSVTGTNYATINSTTGEVTGKKVGNVTVTAKSVADNTVKATYTIAVKDILPTSISVSGADQVMVGSTIKLTATYYQKTPQRRVFLGHQAIPQLPLSVQVQLLAKRLAQSQLPLNVHLLQQLQPQKQLQLWLQLQQMLH